jgi:hypothetical protein
MDVGVEDILVAGLALPPLPADQLDYYPPPAPITRLSARTNVPTDALWAMTVQRYVPLLLGRLDTPYGRRHADAKPCWLFVPPQDREPPPGPPRIAWQDSVQRCGRLCPMCLSHEAPPYRRLSWRLSWMGSCPRHGVMLAERSHGIGERESAARACSPPSATFSSSGLLSVRPIPSVPPICISGCGPDTNLTPIHPGRWTTSPMSTEPAEHYSHVCTHAHPLGDRDYMTYYMTQSDGGML